MLLDQIFEFVHIGWISTGSIKHGRESHTSSVLSNGKVLVAGGINYSSVTILRSSELYDPSTQTWTTAGNLNHRRSDHTVSALLDGKQLVTGGTNLERNLYRLIHLFLLTFLQFIVFLLKLKSIWFWHG